MPKKFKVIQITDIHLFEDESKDLLGVKTFESFNAVVDLVKSESDIDIILLTGDLSQDGSIASYKKVAETLQQFNVPIYFVPGNHDESDMLDRTYPYLSIVSDKCIIEDSWQLVLLNSQVPNAVHGYFEEAEFTFLEKCLTENPALNAMIVFHHQPFPVGAAWLDQLGVHNAAQFWQIIKKYPNVKSVLFGHVHQEGEKHYQGVQCLWTPSTCIQFKTNQDHFGLDPLPPGYRVIELFSDGRIQSKVKRVAKYIGFFDADAKGY